MSKAIILQDIIDKILTGGRRTTAENTRSILNAVVNESYNIYDAAAGALSGTETLGIFQGVSTKTLTLNALSAFIGGGGVNPTSGYLPYNNAGVFADSFFSQTATEALVDANVIIATANTQLTLTGGSNSSDIVISDTALNLRFQNGIGGQSQIFSMDGTAPAAYADTINESGIEYAADYSANFTDLTLITKAYAVSLISATTLAAVLDNGNRTGASNILSDDANSVLSVIDGLVMLSNVSGDKESIFYLNAAANIASMSWNNATISALFSANNVNSQVSHTSLIQLDAPLTTVSATLRMTGATASTVPYFDASKNIVSSAITPTELGYLTGATSSLQAQIDALVTGLSWKQAVRVATTAAGTLATDFENGDTVDGIILATGDRVLIKNQASATENGVYTVNASGAPTRSLDMNIGSEFPSATMAISEGTANADTQFVCTNDSPVTIGVTNIVFVAVGGTTYVGTTNRITVTGNVIDIAAAYIGQSSITTIGTVTTGTWNSAIISPPYGGTGVANNVASTITISGNFATTLTITGVTGVTLPTSGTLATLAGAEAFTNKTYNGNSITSGSGTLTLSTFTLTVANTASVSGTNTGDQTITLTGGVTGSGTGSFAATVITNANLTGVITSVGNATSIASQTGTGTKFVVDTSPTFTTDITTPKIYGGTAVGSNIIFQSTTGTGTTTGISHQFTGGTNGATVNSTLYNDGQFLIATTTRNPSSVGIFRVGQGTSTCDIGQVTAGAAGIWMGQSTPSTTNYALSHSGATFTVLNAPTQAGTILFTALGGAIAAFKGVQTSTVVISYNFTPGNESSLTASTEKVTFNVATSTVNHAAGALALNRYAVINAPTYGFSSASTLTDAVTFEVTAAPILGAGSPTFTRSWVARLLNGNTAIGGSMYVGAAAGTTAPTALLHLAAGTATAGTAPKKYTSGTILTVMEAGVHEYNGNHYLSNATTRFSVGGTLPFDNFADVSVGGAETDIYSATLLANTFNVNGDKVFAMYGGNFVTVGTELTQLKVKFDATGATTIWDSTALAPATGTTSWRVIVELIRVSSTVIRYTVSLNTTGATGYTYCTSGELTGLTLSGTNILKVTGTSSGVGSGAGDIVGKMGYIKINPAS